MLSHNEQAHNVCKVLGGSDPDQHDVLEHEINVVSSRMDRAKPSCSTIILRRLCRWDKSLNFIILIFVSSSSDGDRSTLTPFFRFPFPTLAYVEPTLSCDPLTACLALPAAGYCFLARGLSGSNSSCSYLRLSRIRTIARIHLMSA
jgi:hypothetical protein